jgi:UDP-GlcNAc:undecaprenyl-phosphate/decaprenyl-phosphate GlcNAc-1-phosphate transferase
VSAWLHAFLGKWSGDAPVYLLTLAVGVLAAALAGWPVRALAHRLGAIDCPGGRHIHVRPTPRLGGLAVLAGLFAATIVGCTALAPRRPEMFEEGLRFAFALVMTLGCAVAAIGARDDLRGLSPLAKLAGLGAIGLALALGGVRIDFIELPGLGRFELGWLAYAATVIWVLACTNSVNLIDGVDGLGAGVAAVASLALALVAHGMGEPATATAFCALAGGCGGFLLHNREPARLFLGDSGSLLLGFWLAAWSAQGCTKRATAIFLVVGLVTLAVPLLDSTQAFVRRWRRAGGVRLLQRLRATAIGDREHIHHRLLGRGLSHRRVARTLALCTLLPGLSTLFLLPSGSSGIAALCAGLLATALVLWRLAALPSGRAPAAPQPDPVLPALPPRRGSPRPAASPALPTPAENDLVDAGPR